MKNKFTKISLLCLAICSVIAITVFGINRVAKYEVAKMQATDTTKNASSGPTLVSGETNPSSYSYHTHTGTWEAIYGTNHGIAKYPGFQIYCINPGSPINYSYEIRYADALKLKGNTTTSSHTYDNGHADDPTEGHNGERTPPVYTEAGTYTLPPAAAYIVSDVPIGSWTLEKQRGIWNLRDETIYDGSDDTYEAADGDIIIGGGNSANSGPSKYDTEAVDYAEFDALVRDTGLNPEDKTVLNDVYTDVDQDTQEYIVGPFNMTYTNGIYGNIAFGGITEMKVIGYNSEGKEVNSDIKIKKFILKDTATGVYGSSVEPEYFEPDKTIKIDKTEQVYPLPGQDFKIVFDDPNAGLSEDSSDRVAAISIKVKFQYMLANGKYTKLKGTKYTVAYTHTDTGRHKEYCGGENCKGHTCYRSCKKVCYLKEAQQQWLAAMDAIRSLYEEEFELVADIDNPGTPTIPIDTTMDLGGHVWEDGVATKETKADGVSNTGEDIDKPLKNVKVTLYTSDGEVAKLLSNPNEAGLTDAQVMFRVNPTYTDEEGNYLFEGLDPMKKYYVMFEYNGQIYLPTEYLNAGQQYSSVQQMVNAGLYNTDSWKVTSKGTETVSDRDAYDKKFEEIGSYPENYTSSNSLGKTGSKNATFTQKDLMGYTLDREGKYRQTGTQLIDGYLFDEDGNETTEYKDGDISKAVREYVTKNKKFPDENAMKSDIYNGIAGSDTETWRMLQFIEDCKINSYTQPQGGDKDLYPVYTKFRINHDKNNTVFKTAREAQEGNYDMESDVIDGVEYKPIYPGQFFVNQGLWRRQEYDAALRKDAYRAVMKINNKTIMYKYDKRTDDEEYWDINVRMSDYDAYYGSGYTREVYDTDYNYSSVALGHPGSDLEIYVTYKITIRNQSQSIMTQIKEVVDYYDKDYKYRDDLSWVTYDKNKVTDDEYYAAMVAEDTSKIENAKDINSAKTSKYGSSTRSDITSTYNDVYVKGLENKKLATGESAYIYLTFQVNKENGKVMLDGESDPKMNYAEINGYSTYYRDNTPLPNGVTKNSGDIAGLLDRDSNPGNLVQEDINDKDRYEKNFEDDTDRSKALRVIIDEEAVRKVNGTVWEDKRTESSGEATIGDGIYQSGETKVNGVTVQLVEKTINGKEYIWQETTTNDKGEYSFDSYIPGDYVVRFYYGNTSATTKVQGNSDYSSGGQNDVSYNGQDFKSTTYQKGIDSDYNAETDNETGTYGYNIYEADSKGTNYSDAKDLWNGTKTDIIEESISSVSNSPKATKITETSVQGRQTVIDYSKSNVTNHKAEVLASPYETPSYNGTKYTSSVMNGLIDELMKNTYMTAETGVIVVEFEYDRQQSEGSKTESNGSDKYLNGNDVNGKYELKDIDLGLTERAKAQLEIDKSITNLKVTLANGSVQFDVNQAGDNVIWKDHEEYNLGSKKNDGKYKDYYGTSGKNRYSYRYDSSYPIGNSDKGLIQITMDEELMHGATIEVTYKVKVTNVGEVDYEGQKYYYLGNSDGANIVTTVADQVVDYVANNLQFNSQNAQNNKWTVIGNSTLITSTSIKEDANLVNPNLDNKVKQYNTVIQTDGLNKSLKPAKYSSGEVSNKDEAVAEKTLVLTQLISTENTSDDLTYSNIVEIVKTSNTVGRRMAYSVVGNQDPTASAADEVDSSLAERIIILPPFGDTHIFYILGAVISIILIGGIVFIIKKVNKK